MIGRVYKISNTDDSIVYIGATIRSLDTRWQEHTSRFKRWVAGSNQKPYAIFKYFSSHGLDKFSIHLISTHDIVQLSELRIIEQQAMNQYQTINIIKAYSTGEERAEKKRNGRSSLYAREPILCNCGSQHTRGYTRRHLQTVKHMQWIETGGFTGSEITQFRQRVCRIPIDENTTTLPADLLVA